MGRKRKKIPAGPDSGLYRLSARRKTDCDNILQKGWKKKPQGGWAYTNSDGTEVSAPTMDLAIIFARKNEVLCTKCGCTDYIPAGRKRRSICGNCREAGDEEDDEEEGEEDGEGMEEMQEDVAPGSDADEESAVSGTEEDMELQAELEEPTVTIKYTTTKTNSKKKRMIYIGCQRWRWDRLKGAYTLQNNKEVAQLLLDWYEMSGGAYEKNRDEASRQIIMATLADAHSRSWKRKKEDEGGDEMNASSIGTGTNGTVPICPTRAGQDDAGLPGNHNGNRTISNLANTSQACDHSGGYTAADPCETKTEDGSTVAPSSVPPVAQVPDTTLDKDSTLASEETQTLLGAHILECSSGSDEFNFGGNLQTDTVQVKVEPDDISDSCGSINIETVVKVEQVGETSEDHDHSDDAESELMHQDSVIIPEASDLGPAAEKVFSQTVDTEVEETKTRDLYSKGKVSGLSEQSTSNQAGTSEANQGDVNHRLIPEVSGSPSFPSKEVLAQSADPNLKQKNSAEKIAHRKARQRLLRPPAVKQDSCLPSQTQLPRASGSTSGPCPHLSATGTSALRRADGEKKATAASVDPRDQHPPSETQNSSLGSKVSSSSVSCAPSRILVLRSGSGTETSVAVYEGPAAAAKLQEVESGRYSKNSQLPKSTAYYQKRKLLEDQIRAEKGEPPKKRYQKYKAHYTCRKCGRDRTKETGHSQVYGNWYCPFDPDRLPVEEWRALMRSKIKRK